MVKKSKPAKLKSLTYWATSKADANAAKKGLAYGAAVGNGMNVARQLGNLPANICTPTFLANQAKALAKGQPKVTTNVLSEADMKKLKMGSLLSVSAGSDQPAKLIVIKYQGAKASVKPTVLVGKAVTFDTGGISLKAWQWHGRNEIRYVRRRLGYRCYECPDRKPAAGQCGGHYSCHRKYAQWPGHQARRRSHQHVWPDH